MVLAGKIYSATNMVVDIEVCVLFLPNKIDPKSNLPVIDVLKKKHPHIRIPDLNDPDCVAFEEYEKLPGHIPPTITSEMVIKVVSKLHGGAGLCGVDSHHLKNLLLRHG